MIPPVTIIQKFIVVCIFGGPRSPTEKLGDTMGDTVITPTNELENWLVSVEDELGTKTGWLTQIWDKIIYVYYDEKPDGSRVFVPLDDQFIGFTSVEAAKACWTEEKDLWPMKGNQFVRAVAAVDMFGMTVNPGTNVEMMVIFPDFIKLRRYLGTLTMEELADMTA